ncbi:MAG: diguanylate cyclase [Reinekea sp.]
MSRLILHSLLLLLLINVSCHARAEFAEPPFVDAAHRTQSGELDLSGDWALIWNRWVPLAELTGDKLEYVLVSTPDYLWNQIPLADPEATTIHGIATYIKDIHHLQQGFIRPAISMKFIGNAWEAWWIEQSQPAMFLGRSGKMGRSKAEETIAENTYILELPRNSNNGRLVVYVSAYHLAKSGLYGHTTIREQEAVLKSLAIDIASRAFLTGLGLYVVIQNMVIYIRRPKEQVLLLLAIFCATGVLRSALASRYIDYFIPSAEITTYLYRMEYLLLPWPAIAALHYMMYLFPIRYGKQIIKVSYLLLAVLAVITFSLPIEIMTSNLTAYQISLLVYAAICLGVISNGVIRRMPDSKHILRSFIPLILAIFNDIYAANTAGYNFYIAEYALFIFLFLQTQIQASRFVAALETSEHLTANLQKEVDRKTQQLSDRNAILEEKASHLEARHEEIKLLSETDHLTGLFNRQTLEYRSNLLFQIASSFDQPLSVIMMDLDHFKTINDQYGHQGGDECLIFTASYLHGLNLRKRDLIARYGGEEIIIMLPDTAVQAATDIANTICRGLRLYPTIFEQHQIFLTASFGVAELNSAKAISISHLISCADQALYRAKQNGRNRVEAYHSDMETE